MKYNKQTKSSIAKSQAKANHEKSISNSAPARSRQAASASRGARKMQEQEITINLAALQAVSSAQPQSKPQARASGAKPSNHKQPQKAAGRKRSKNKSKSRNPQKSASYQRNEQLPIRKQAKIQSSREQMRQSNAVRHKKRRKRNYILHYILLGILLTVTVITLSYTVLFNVKSIEITDNTILSDEEITAAAGVKVGDNLLKINKKKTELRVLNSTIYFDRVKVSRKFPSTLSIKIDVASPVTGIRYGGMHYYFSKNDRLIAIDEQEKYQNIPIVWGIDLNKMKLGEYLIASEENEYETFLILSEQIKKSEIGGINAVDIRDPANVKLYYENRIEIQLGSIQELDYKLKIAKEILKTKIEAEETGILDVQISGKAYFRIAENTDKPR